MSYMRTRRSTLCRIAQPVLAAVVVASVAACAGSETLDTAATDPSVIVDNQLLDVAQFARHIESDDAITVINVHIPYEGHLDGTDAFIPFDMIVESAELPVDRSAPLALYCRSGAMSAAATAALGDAGYTSVVDLDGGMNAWVDSGRVLLDDPSAAS